MKINRKTNILPFEPPLLGLYPHISNIFAMYENNVYTLPPVVSELMGMVYDKELDRVDFAISLEILQYMNNYPLMYNHGISRNIAAAKWKSYSDFVVDMIDEGYYVHNLLDTYYISAYGETYMREHYSHNSMIYGYDYKSKIFYMADAFEKGIYEAKTATFKEVNDAFINTHVGDWYDGIRLYKLKEDPFAGLGYNTEYISEQCENYLKGELPVSISNLEKRRRTDIPDRFTYGINIYNEMISYVKRLEHNGDTWENGDVRMFYAIFDHMNVYIYLIKQLMQRNQIVDADRLYKKAVLLAEKTKKMYMNIIKYNLTGKQRTRETLISSLGEYKNEDCEFVRDFAEAIKPENVDKYKQNYTMPEIITADSIMMEYDDEKNWIRKTISDYTYYSDKLGAKAKCQFFGNSLRIGIVADEKYGQAQVLVDGEEYAIIDYTKEDEVCVNGFETGYHTFELINLTEGKFINLKEIRPMAEAECDMEDYTAVRRELHKKGTGGGLIHDYGMAGYDIVGYKRNLPAYMTLCNYRVKNVVNVLLMHNTADSRGVRKERDSRKNIAAYALSDKEFSLDMVIPGKEKTITFYMVDYDNLARSMKVIVENADTGKVYDICDVEAFVNGELLSYRIKGHVRVRFINMSGPDAVLSGVWFDR